MNKNRMNTLTDQITEKVSPTITNMIRMDHTHVLATFHQYEIDSSPRAKKALVDTICMALEIHAQLEEEIFYPAMRRATLNDSVLDKSVPEHNEMRDLIAQLRNMQATDANYDDTVMELMRDVMHHVADEETVLLPQAERILRNELGQLGAQMTKRRLQLLKPRAGELAVNTARTMPTSSILMAAGALMAGTYMLRKSFGNHDAGVSR